MTSCRSPVSRAPMGRRRCASRSASIAHSPPGARRSCCSKRACGWRASMCAPCGRSVCRSSWRVPWPRRPPAVGEQLSILRLIAQASVPVQIVIGILLLASLGSWAIIFRKRRVIGRARREADRFEGRFWSGDDLAQLKEIDRLEQSLATLATVGSTSPYVGLFGTVWGIMSAFSSLGNVQQATLAMVAPGISEALVATAIGLFAAIPAVVAYNRFADQVTRLEMRFDAFIEEFSTILQRHASRVTGPPPGQER